MAKEITILWRTECKRDETLKKDSLDDVIPLGSWTRRETLWSPSQYHEEWRERLDHSMGRLERNTALGDESLVKNPHPSRSFYQGTGLSIRSMTLPGLSSHQREKFRKKLSFFERTKKKFLRKNQKTDTDVESKKEANIFGSNNGTNTKIDNNIRNLGDSQTNKLDKISKVALKQSTSSGSFCSSSPICFDSRANKVDTFIKQKRSRLRVLFDFEACEENDVSARRGELVVVYNKEDRDWLWIETSDGRQGFVPRSYIWPCGCYVCQTFVQERLSSLAQDDTGQTGSNVSMGTSCLCCLERKQVKVMKSLVSTWC